MVGWPRYRYLKSSMTYSAPKSYFRRRSSRVPSGREGKRRRMSNEGKTIIPNRQMPSRGALAGAKVRAKGSQSKLT